MKRKEHGVLLAGLLAIGLSACTTDKMDRDTASTTATESATGVSYGAPPASPAPADQGAAASATPATASTTPGSAEMPAAPTGPQTAAMAPNSVVTLIEVVPRTGDATGAGTVAGAAVGGTAPASDRVYRITVRMDDGSTRVITQESAPTFRSGDRVNLSGGEIQRR